MSLEFSEYVATLSNKNLLAYLRLCMRVGDASKVAGIEYEIQRRREAGRWVKV